MGSILNKPVTEKKVQTFEFEGKSGALVEMQGWRVSMEVGQQTVVVSVGCSRD